MRIAKQRLFWCTLTSVILVAGFQNCDNIKFRESSSVRSGDAQMSGNGDGYGGKITIYHHIDPVKPCSDTASSGRPLPNGSVFLHEKGKAQIVRESCRDVIPRDLAPGQFVVGTGGAATLSSESYQIHTPTDFEAAVAACPAGLNPVAGGPRENLIDNALDLRLDPWGTLGGIHVALSGSLAGLPSYLLTRDVDAASANHLRLDQYVNLNRNTRYAFSFLARRGSAPSVRLMMFDQSPNLMFANAVWSLNDGSLLSSEAQTLTQISMTSRPVGDAFFYTIHFRTPNTVRGLDIGIAADDNSVGSSVFATAAQLEDVSTFCGP